MWNFGNFNPWAGQLASLWKNRGSGFNWWGGMNQQPAAPVPDPTPTPVKPAISQRVVLDQIIDEACRIMPNYNYYTMQLSAAMTNHEADCISYSLFTKIACDAMGITCDVIFGTNSTSALFNGYHIWNRVVLDGISYWSDITYKNWGNESCRAFTVPGEGQAGLANYYVINVADGTYRELEELDLSLPYKATSNFCMAAQMVAATEKAEYPKCWDSVTAALRSAGIL